MMTYTYIIKSNKEFTLHAFLVEYIIQGHKGGHYGNKDTPSLLLFPAISSWGFINFYMYIVNCF